MAYLRALIYQIGTVLATLIVGTMTILSFALPFETRYRITQLWTRFNIWWLKVTCGVNYRLVGVEHIPDQPCIVLAKHQSTWETYFLQGYLPPIAWVLKRELLHIPVFGWSLRLLEPIAINRSSSKIAVKQVLDQGTEALKKGRWVLLFPEGTRTAPGKRQRYRLGGARLAAHSGFPILPVAHNAGEFWPRHSFTKNPGTVTLVFGPLIHVSAQSTPDELNHAVETWIENVVAEISTLPSPPTAQSSSEHS